MVPNYSLYPYNVLTSISERFCLNFEQINIPLRPAIFFLVYLISYSLSNANFLSRFPNKARITIYLLSPAVTASSVDNRLPEIRLRSEATIFSIPNILNKSSSSAFRPALSNLWLLLVFIKFSTQATTLGHNTLPSLSDKLFPLLFFLIYFFY